jgi:hypothetical protein
MVVFQLVSSCDACDGPGDTNHECGEELHGRRRQLRSPVQDSTPFYKSTPAALMKADSTLLHRYSLGEAFKTHIAPGVRDPTASVSLSADVGKSAFTLGLSISLPHYYPQRWEQSYGILHIRIIVRSACDMNLGHGHRLRASRASRVDNRELPIWKRTYILAVCIRPPARRMPSTRYRSCRSSEHPSHRSEQVIY